MKSGIFYDVNKDSAIISLSDSSLHVIYQASTNPALLPPPPLEPPLQSPISSINLSLTSRSFAAIVEKLESQRTLDAGDLAITSGLTAFDEFGTMVWFAEQVMSYIVVYLQRSDILFLQNDKTARSRLQAFGKTEEYIDCCPAIR